MALGITAEEFLMPGHFPPNTQLIDGVVVMADAKAWHNELGMRITEALRTWVRRSGQGWALHRCNWVVDDRNVYVPDGWWVADPRRLDPGTWLDGAPDIVVEVLSPATYRFDVGTKLEHYEQRGSAELWLVDVDEESVIVNRRTSRSAERFDVVLDLRRGESLTTPVLPGFALSIDELFADLP